MDGSRHTFFLGEVNIPSGWGNSVVTSYIAWGSQWKQTIMQRGFYKIKCNAWENPIEENRMLMRIW